MGTVIDRIAKCKFRKSEIVARCLRQLCLHPSKGGLCSYNGNSQSYHCKHFAQREE